MNPDEHTPGTVIARQYELVRRILSHLPMKDLKVFSSVCKLWHDAAKQERLSPSRQCPRLVSWRGSAQKLDYYLIAEPLASPVHEDLNTFLKKYYYWNCPVDPSVALTISVGEPEGEDIDQQSFLVDCVKLESVLPPGCRAVSISSGGVVIGGDAERDHPLEIENLGQKVIPASGTMLFPKVRGVDIVPFTLSETTSGTRLANDIRATCDHQLTDEEFDWAVQRHFLGKHEHDDKVKCVLFMSNILDYPSTSLLIQSIVRRQEGKVTIGGCVGSLARNSDIDSGQDMAAMLAEMASYREESPNSYAKTVGLAFMGDNVEAASILLSRDIKSPGGVEKELQKLKDCGLNERQSCAFMFACCGRGRNFYRNKGNVESAAFYKMFPNTPLLGIFGGGEIGFTHIPGSIKPKETFNDVKRRKLDAKQPISLNEFSHSFTTVFVLISFKR